MQSTREITLGIFEGIRRRYPTLSMELNEAPEHVALALNIRRQPGLLFDIHLNLQNRDELHLSVGDGFWTEWFPCTKPTIVDAYTEAVHGLLDGAFRILEYRVKGAYRRGYLQRPDGPGWKTVCSSYRGWALPWQRTVEHVLQNVAA